ncbi:Protein Mdm4 [Armadillidium nasatum]|uniref:Protein Mdm4 n=1 Tax=Armadillidium nasatum TaxID=96803 RepID=A0A5N5SLU0_9CRUS|nr:Protein Mdm4 [Armadillidium nasatum]
MASETSASNGCLESEQPDFSNSIIPSPQKDPQENGDKERNSHNYNKLGDTLCVLNNALQTVFSPVGAIRRVYNVHEILDLLEKYLSKNKSLIDPLDPKFINCANTDLGRAFGVDKFEYKDVGKLLAKNVTAVNSTEALGSKMANLDSDQYDAGHSFCSDSVGTITCTSDSIASVPSTSSPSSQNFRKLNTSFMFTVPEIPDCLSGPESEYSNQGFDTALVDNSDSDVEQKSVHSAQEEVEEEVVEEYELASETETELKSQNDTESDFENIVLIFGVEARDDSDEDCFADHSSSSSSDSEGHSTEDEKDQWSCVSCGIKNKPFMRYCEKCWQLRKDWYPDPPKRLRKRKPRVKKDRKRVSCDSDEKTNSKAEEVNEDSKKGEVNEDFKEKKVKEDIKKGGLNEDNNEEEEETATEDGREEDVNENIKETLSDTLVRTSSIASTSTVVSTCSSSSASSSVASQDSGFGSQELSSFDIYIPRKRKASESEEGKRKVLKTVDDVEETADKLIKKLKKFSKTSKGIRWLKSEAARDLLELMNETSSDSDCEVAETQDFCPLCCSRPKDASIIHGRLSHIGFCYPCAKRLYNSKSKCPVCRRKIHMITKNAYV